MDLGGGRGGGEGEGEGRKGEVHVLTNVIILFYFKVHVSEKNVTIRCNKRNMFKSEEKRRKREQKIIIT